MRKSIRVLWQELIAALREEIKLVHLDAVLFVVPCIRGMLCRQACAFGAPAAFGAADGTGESTRIAVIGDAIGDAVVLTLVVTSACNCVDGVREDELSGSHFGWAGSNCL